MKRNDGAWIGLASTFRTRPTVKQVWTPQFDPDLLDPTGWKKILCRESDLILRRPSCFFFVWFLFCGYPGRRSEGDTQTSAGDRHRRPFVGYRRTDFSGGCNLPKVWGNNQETHLFKTTKTPHRFGVLKRKRRKIKHKFDNLFIQFVQKNRYSVPDTLVPIF